MTAIIAPGRSLEQRMEALQRANEIRSERAEFKRDLKAGRASLALALMEPPEWLETAKIAGLLRACPALGPIKVDKILRVCRISPSKTVGGISPRQRAELVSHIPAAFRPAAATRPARSSLQYMRALSDGNETRLARSQLKLAIALGTRSIASVLADVPREAESMTIANLLTCQHRWGRSRTRRLLIRLNVPEGKQVGSLTRRQRDAIADALTAPVRNECSPPRPHRPVQVRSGPAPKATVLRARGGVLHVVGVDDHYTPCGLASWQIPDAAAAEWDADDARCRKCVRVVNAKGMIITDPGVGR